MKNLLLALGMLPMFLHAQFWQHRLKVDVLLQGLKTKHLSIFQIRLLIISIRYGMPTKPLVPLVSLHCIQESLAIQDPRN